jgi:uncharacterized protein YdhG (YjbR/CyaY superfamily)
MATPAKKPRASATATSDEAAKAAAYLKALPAKARSGLRELGRSILAAAPGAEVAFSYAMPAYRFEGRLLAWMAAFSEHSSFFPGASPIREFAGELKAAGYKTSKGTIQFPHGAPLPADLVQRLVQVRVEEIRKASAAKSRPRTARSR